MKEKMVEDAIFNEVHEHRKHNEWPQLSDIKSDN